MLTREQAALQLRVGEIERELAEQRQLIERMMHLLEAKHQTCPHTRTTTMKNGGRRCLDCHKFLPKVS